jgi:uncharacterized membrane protein YhhN
VNIYTTTAAGQSAIMEKLWPYATTLSVFAAALLFWRLSQLPMETKGPIAAGSAVVLLVGSVVYWRRKKWRG